MQDTRQLCKIPKFLSFEYHEGQQLVATMTIENLVQKVINYKIKSNKLQLYLVKPMEGSIYNKESAKIVFKRKILSKQAFENYVLNPASIQQKFKIQVTCTERDMIGIDREHKQQAFVLVKFHRKDVIRIQNQKQSFHSKKQQQLNQLKQKIQLKKKQYSRLSQQEKKLQQSLKSPIKSQNVSKQNIIILLIWLFVFGLAFGK